jgi:hypothetical protein
MYKKIYIFFLSLSLLKAISFFEITGVEVRNNDQFPGAMGSYFFKARILLVKIIVCFQKVWLVLHMFFFSIAG